MHVVALVLAALLTTSVATTAIASAPSPTPSPDSASTSVPFLAWEVVTRRAHDSEAFTQGLLLDADGRLFESTGRYGASTVREVDAASGEVLRRRTQPADQFGEGLALVDDELIQLTWRSGLARRYEKDTFDVIGRHRYGGEGWGLCYDGERLVMSDGSDELTYRDPVTFEAEGSVAVTVGARPLTRLNELECVKDEVWANVWQTDAIVRIDPADGLVTGVLDLAGIIAPDPAAADGGAVLNGIAYDATADTFLVTGKLWPELIEIRVLGPEDASAP